MPFASTVAKHLSIRGARSITLSIGGSGRVLQYRLRTAQADPRLRTGPRGQGRHHHAFQVRLRHHRPLDVGRAYGSKVEQGSVKVTGVGFGKSGPPSSNNPAAAIKRGRLPGVRCRCCFRWAVPAAVGTSAASGSGLGRRTLSRPGVVDGLYQGGERYGEEYAPHALQAAEHQHRHDDGDGVQVHRFGEQQRRQHVAVERLDDQVSPHHPGHVPGPAELDDGHQQHRAALAERPGTSDLQIQTAVPGRHHPCRPRSNGLHRAPAGAPTPSGSPPQKIPATRRCCKQIELSAFETNKVSGSAAGRTGRTSAPTCNKNVSDRQPSKSQVPDSLWGSSPVPASQPGPEARTASQGVPRSWQPSHWRNRTCTRCRRDRLVERAGGERGKGVLDSAVERPGNPASPSIPLPAARPTSATVSKSPGRIRGRVLPRGLRAGLTAVAEQVIHEHQRHHGFGHGRGQAGRGYKVDAGDSVSRWSPGNQSAVRASYTTGAHAGQRQAAVQGNRPRPRIRVAHAWLSA